MSRLTTLRRNKLIKLCNGHPPEICTCQDVITYNTPVQVPDKYRRSLVCSKSYLGNFTKETIDLENLLKRLNCFQYVLWEKVLKNPNDLQTYLILKVTFRRPYNRCGSLSTQSIGLSSTGLFFLVHLKTLPGNIAPWYYPLLEYPSFKYVSDLLKYLEFMPKYSAYDNKIDKELEDAESKYINYNKYHMLTYIFKGKTINVCRFCAYKNKDITCIGGNVRSLQNLTSCFIQGYSYRLAFDPTSIVDLKGKELPNNVYNYMVCCSNYMYDDALLHCSCISKQHR